MEYEDNIVLTKAEAFAIRIIKLYRYLQKEKDEKIMSKQLLRCGTSVGANLTESNDAISHAEFIAKTQIALKECSESLYWLKLLVQQNTSPKYNMSPLPLTARRFNTCLLQFLNRQKTTKPRDW